MADDLPVPRPVPGLRGADHIGLTVPDLEQAVAFFADVLGCRLMYRMGPFADEGTWFADELGVDPRARIPAMALMRCGSGANLELIQYEAPGQGTVPPTMSDAGGHHLAFYVEDMAAAVDGLAQHGITPLGHVKPGMGPEAGDGTAWVFFHSPWGLPLELVSYPSGRAYEATTEDRLWHPAHPER